MMRGVMVLLAVLFSLPAWAQRPPQSPQTPPAVEQTLLALRQLSLSLDEMMKAHVQEMAAFRQRIADMDAYLKACGDKPGCTVPVEETKP